MKRIICLLLILIIISSNLSGCLLFDFEKSANKELIDSLIHYLQSLACEYELPDSTIETKIDRIKNGTQALLVNFDKSNYYFVCGYHNSKHESEETDYCCAAEYTWIKFDNEKEIKSNHFGKKMIVAFQINKSTLVDDIVSEKSSVPSIEHFQIFEPLFDSKKNLNDSLTFDKTYIYLNNSEKSTIYHTSLSFDNEFVTMPCVFTDENYYIMTHLYSEYTNGEKTDYDPSVIFGKYSDSLSEIMEKEHYALTNKLGTIKYYALIRVDAFAKFVNEEK